MCKPGRLDTLYRNSINCDSFRFGASKSRFGRTLAANAGLPVKPRGSPCRKLFELKDVQGTRCNSSASASSATIQSEVVPLEDGQKLNADEAWLATFLPFSRLEVNALKELAAAVKPRKVAQGDSLAEPGVEMTELLVLREGGAAVVEMKGGQPGMFTCHFDPCGCQSLNIY
jgi:hypothetical protein